MTRARENPFRVECLHRLRFRVPAFQLPEIVEEFLRRGRRGAIVGGHGTGKTTLLAEFIDELRDRGEEVSLLRLSSELRGTADSRVKSWLQETHPETVLVLDGAEQLRRKTWSELERNSLRFSGILITLHYPGRLPTLVRTTTSPELLQSLVEELIGCDCRSQGDALQRLFRRHRGNLRDCLRELYDHYPDWPPI